MTAPAEVPPKPPKKDAKIEVRIPGELKSRVQRKAAQQGKTLSDVIRPTLERWVNGPA